VGEKCIILKSAHLYIIGGKTLLKKERVEQKLTNHEWDWLKNDGKKILNKLIEYNSAKIETPSIRKLAKNVNGRYETIRDRIKIMSELGLIEIPSSITGESKNCKITDLGKTVSIKLNYKSTIKEDVDRIIFGPQFDSMYRNNVISKIANFRNNENKNIDQASYLDSLNIELNLCIERFGNDCYELSEFQSFISSIPGSNFSRDVKWKAFSIFQRMIKYKPTINHWLNIRKDLIDNLFFELELGDQASISALHLLGEFRNQNNTIPDIIFKKINEIIPVTIDINDQRSLVTTEAIIPVFKSWSNVISYNQCLTIQKTLTDIKNNMIDKNRIKKIYTIFELDRIS
jgi:hypothetical protein